MDNNVVITLQVLVAHSDFGFTVTVLTQDGSATRETVILVFKLLLLIISLFYSGLTVDVVHQIAI